MDTHEAGYPNCKQMCRPWTNILHIKFILSYIRNDDYLTNSTINFVDDAVHDRNWHRRYVRVISIDYVDGVCDYYCYCCCYADRVIHDDHDSIDLCYCCCHHRAHTIVLLYDAVRPSIQYSLDYK